ncbi:MAG: Maf-like protein [Clostridium sp.]|nr:Maf-like protein [Clostridium sp.]
MNFILASGSPRRVELFKRIVDKFSIIVSEFDEKKVKFNGDVSEYVKTLAASKAKKVAQKQSLRKYKNSDSIIIGFDTVVSINNMVLGKPKDEKSAFEMLKMLSGKEHTVYTGIAILNLNTNKIKCDYACTKVRFSNLSDEMILKYIHSEEYKDKAGAYAIQGKASVFVESIEGCFYNVVGLPLNKLNKMFGEMGINL